MRTKNLPIIMTLNYKTRSEINNCKREKKKKTYTRITMF